MTKSVKVELSIKTLAVIAEALGEAGSVEWLRGDAGDAEAKARYSRYWSALYDLRMAGCDAVAGSILENRENWGGAHRWLTAAENKGSALAWSAREAARAELAAEIARSYGRRAESEVA